MYCGLPFFFFLVLPCLDLSLLGNTLWWYISQPTVRCQGRGGLRCRHPMEQLPRNSEATREGMAVEAITNWRCTDAGRLRQHEAVKTCMYEYVSVPWHIRKSKEETRKTRHGMEPGLEGDLQ